MSKTLKFSLALICVVCLFVSAMGGYAAAAEVSEQTEEDELFSVPIYIDGVHTMNGFMAGGVTYVSIRALSYSLVKDIDIYWDQDTVTAYLTAQGLEITATAGEYYIEANNRYLYIPYSIINLNGTMLVPVRELAKVFNLSVSWDPATEAVHLGTENFAFIENGDTFYADKDVYWLSRVINAEANNQPMSGKIGVGNVVLNRVADPTCPDTVYDVIFDRRYGVQFSVITTGAIYMEPSESSIIAAKICFEGYETVGDSLYFLNPEISSNSWFERTRTYVTTLGDHAFYA